MLIASLSGRSLAAAADRAGYLPLVADVFGDLDTRQCAGGFELLPGGLKRGMEAEALLTALGRLSDGYAPQGLVCGSGFEGRTRLLATLAERWPLIGNRAEVVARLKDPAALSELCRRLSIPHPEIALSPPEHSEGWLAKRVGGAGGVHIHSAKRTSKSGDRQYFQRRVKGASISSLFLADGRRAKPLGFSRQWTDPCAAAPFRYGGAVRLSDHCSLPIQYGAVGVVPPPSPSDGGGGPCEAWWRGQPHRRRPPPPPPSGVPLPRFAGEDPTSIEMLAAVEAIVPETGLVGLNSADFIVKEEEWWLLEINPRPGATLDIFKDRDGLLFAQHVEACRGTLPDEPLHFAGSAAAAIVYASVSLASVPAIGWPEWAADRQSPGTQVAQGEPLCTVLSEAETAGEAVRLVHERKSAVRDLLEKGAPS